MVANIFILLVGTYLLWTHSPRLGCVCLCFVVGQALYHEFKGDWLDD